MTNLFLLSTVFCDFHDKETCDLAEAYAKTLNDDRAQVFAIENVDFRQPHHDVFNNSNIARLYLEAVRRWAKAMDTPAQWRWEKPHLQNIVLQIEAAIQSYENRKGDREHYNEAVMSRIAEQIGDQAFQESVDTRLARLEHDLAEVKTYLKL